MKPLQRVWPFPTRLRLSHEWVFLLPILVFLGLFVAYPMVNIVRTSFVDNTTGGYTVENYVNAFGGRNLQGLKNTIWFAVLCMGIGITGGSFVGLLASRFPPRIRGFLLSLYSLPNTMSSLVVAFSFIVLLGRNGVLNLIISRFLGLPKFELYTWQGLIVTYSFYMIPLMTLTMASVFVNLDRSLIEAARNLGAKTTQVWRHVIIPILAPGFVAGASIMLAAMLAAFGTALALTGLSKNLLALQIFSYASASRYNIPRASALAVMLGIVTALSLFILNRIERWLGGGRRV